MTKLTEEQVSEIRLERRQGKKLREIASEFEVHESHIWRIVNGEQRRPSPPMTCPHCRKAISL